MAKDVIIIGAGGHGKVIADIISASGDNVVGFLDDNTHGTVFGYPVMGKVNDCTKHLEKYFIIAIGDNKTRKKIAEKYSDLKYYTAIHPTAVLCCDAVVGEGSCVMANAVINASAVIGKHCIINTHSTVEHDNKINDFVHISPGAVLCGGVSVGECTHIGANVAVRNYISVTDNCVVGVGAAVVKDINEAGVYMGVPAKKK